jgi:GT2 family glycosyltransferase
VTAAMTASTVGTTAAGRGAVTIVVITRDRRESLLHTVARLRRLPGAPPVVVIDNASSDGTAAALQEACPDVEVMRLDRNLGAAGRTEGVLRAGTPYVAFSDDDSWWDDGSLDTAATVLDQHPSVALLAARLLVGPEGRLDPVCHAMADSPLGVVPGVGPAILGFVACGAVVRRSAYLEAGGFHPRFGVGGEESLLAIDLVERGWQCAYDDRVVARHHPSPHRVATAREARVLRNDLWTLWLRHRPGAALAGTVRRLRQWPNKPVRTGLRQAIGGWRWVRHERVAVAPSTGRLLQRLSAQPCPQDDRK